MDERDTRKKADALDAFWDIDALIPPRRAPHYAHDTNATEIVLEPKKEAPEARRDAAIPQRKQEPERHFIPPHTANDATRAPQPDLEYTPEDSLIHTVRLYTPGSSYRYHEDFVRDAMRLYAVRGLECPHIPFFSYVPQYSQMNREQLEWYLWWRECFRRGEILSTDYSYLLLYAYEVINLGAHADPAASQKALCTLWISYRSIFHQLDGYLPEWICDFSLIHRLPPPPELEGQSLLAVMSRCTLKEFYIASVGEEGLIRILPVFCSNYDFHKSKFCTTENKSLFERSIYGTLREVREKMGKEGLLFNERGTESSRMVRDAYSGALCAWSVKRKIAVEYTSFSCSHELRYFVTDVIKYAENRIRAYLGVRSRLSIYALPSSVRDIIDAYLDVHLPRREAVATRQREAEIAAYERLYDLPRTPLSLSHAQEIERVSWDTTEQLVEAFEDEGADMNVPEEPLPLPLPTTETMLAPDVDTGASDPFFAAMQPYFTFLAAALAKDGGEQSAIAKQMGKMTDAVADEINELAAEHTGDILLEEDANGYAVIEDYCEIASQLLNRGKDDR